MVHQPITVFEGGKAITKDALYYTGNYYGVDKHGNDLPSAPFAESYYKKPKLAFVYADSVNPYDSKMGKDVAHTKLQQSVMNITYF